MFARSTPESRNEARDQAHLIGQLQTSVTKNASRELQALASHPVTGWAGIVAMGAFIGAATQIIESINL